MISKIAVKRPVTMIMVLIAILALGVVSMFKMPQALMPNMNYPVALVTVSYSGASPQEIDDIITEPMESALASVENVKEMTSYSMEGASTIVIEFNIGTDMNFATLDIREKISMAQQIFPKEASAPVVMKANMNMMPVMELYVSSENMNTGSLSSYIEDNVISNFKRLPGVAAVNISGETNTEINMYFDQSKLQGYGLSMSSISQQLSSENINVPSGSIKNGSIDTTVRIDGRLKSIADIRQMPITLSDGTSIMLQDVADISEKKTEPDTITRINGKSAIGISISKASDANLVDLSDSILKAMHNIEAEHGDEIKFEVGYDGAEFVRTSIKSVSKSAMQGAILAILIIFIFLRNFRSTLVIGLSIPASMLATFGVMKLLGMSLNIMTLGALTISIGMVVDNSVVVLENIFRRNKQGLNAKEASIKGSSEVILAVMASTLTSVVVYLPIALAPGIAGMIFKDFAFTIITVLSMSLIVSITIVPMLSSKLLDNSVSEDYVRVGKFFYRYKFITGFTKFIEAMQSGYVSVAKWMLVRRKRVIAFMLILFISSIGLIGMVGVELMPSTDNGQFTINVDMPAGTETAEKDAYMSKIEKYCMEIPELKTVTLSTDSSNALSTSKSGSISVQLVDSDKRERSTNEVMKDVKKQFKDFVGADITYSSDSGSDSGASAIDGPDMRLQLEGNDVSAIRKAVVDLEAYIKENSKNVGSVTTDVNSGIPEIILTLNRSAAAKYGVTASMLSDTLSEALSGVSSTKVNINDEDVTLKLQLRDNYKSSVENMKSIVITTPTGIKVPIGQIAEISYDNEPVTIYKENQKIQSSVDIKFKDGVDIKKGSAEIDALMKEYIMPSGVTLNTGGATQQIDESFGDLFIALLLSILLVYVVLASQFESFILPVMIMMSIPFAMSGSFLALFLTGNKLSMVSIIAFIMLIGMVVNNAILLVEFINQNKEIMDRDEAIAQAGSVRLRPILMTTLTTILGMMPMATGIGEGSKTMAPMAIAMIGGMTASTIITLFLIPVLYAIVDDKEHRIGIKRRNKKKIHLYQEALWLAKGAEKLEEKRIKKESKKKSHKTENL